MDVRIRNSEWESDGELKRELSKYVTKGLQRNEILSYLLRDFPQYSWSIKTLDRRMRYFNIFYHSSNVSLNAVKEAVKGDLNGPGKLLGYRAMNLKIRQKKRAKRYKGSTLACEGKNIMGSSFSQKAQYSTMSVMVCRGAFFVLKEKFLTSYLMLESSFI